MRVPKRLNISLSEQQQYLTFADHSDTIAIFLSNEFNILNFNQKAKSIYKWNKTILNQSYLEWCALNHIDCPFSTENAALLESKHFVNDVKSVINPSNKVLSWAISHNFDSKGNIIGTIMLGKDLTDYQHVLDHNRLLKDNMLAVYKDLALVSKNITGIKIDHKQSAKDYILKVYHYLENIISRMPCYVYWKDKKLRYLGCNDLTAKILKLNSRHDIVGKTDYDYGWDKSQVDKFLKVDKKILATGEAQLNIEESIPDENGNKVDLLVNKMPVFDAENHVIGIVGISVDITEMKNTQRHLQEAKEKAEAANIAKTNLTRNLDHSILTPFSGVYSLLEVLEKQETDPEKKEFLHMAYLSAKELLELCQHILDSMRVTSNDDPVLEMKIDLKELLESIIKLDHPATRNKHLELIFHYPPDLPTIFLTDGYRLKRIVMNLVDNAIKFTEKGYLKLSVELGKQLDDKNFIIKILVEDTGIGIAPENHDYIYQTFSRINPANMGKYAGLGLGLFTTKHFIQDLGGEIDLISSLEKGSTFICTLPMKRPLLDEILHHNDDASLN